MSAVTVAPGERSAAHVWMKALEKTAPIAKNPTRLLVHVLEEQAMQRGGQVSIFSDAQFLCRATKLRYAMSKEPRGVPLSPQCTGSVL